MGMVSSLADSQQEYAGAGMTAIPMPTNQGSKHYAQDMNAWLHRQQWDDYKARYQPVENQLIDETMGTQLLDERLGKISATNDKAFNASMMNSQIVQGRYGIHQGESQAQAQMRSALTDKSTAVADGMNNTRTHVYDRNMNTLAGGASVAGQAIR